MTMTYEVEIEKYVHELEETVEAQRELIEELNTTLMNHKRLISILDTQQQHTDLYGG